MIRLRSQNVFEEAQKLDRPILLTPKQVAATGLMTLYAVRQGIAAGTIPYIKIGSHYRVNYGKLLEQIQGC